MIPQEISDKLKAQFGAAIHESVLDGVHDPFVLVAPGKMGDIARFLRDTGGMDFDALMCLSGLDIGDNKFRVVYHLHSMKWNHKFTIKLDIPLSHPHVASVESVWKTANWHEREAFDLFGIVFDGHPDLRRILLPDDWEGHPLRKDFQVPEFYNGMKVPY